MTNAQFLWTIALVLCMDRFVPNDIPVVKEENEDREEEENASNS